MHRLYRNTSLALSFVLGAGYAFAEDKPREDRAGVKVEVNAGKRDEAKKLKEIRKVSDITGFSLSNRQDESLGGISELVMSQDGKIKYAIIGHGGVLGIGQDYIAVPWQKLDVDYNQETIRMDMAKAELERAPTFKRDNYQELQNPEWTARVHQHFGVKADAHKEGEAAKPRDAQAAQPGEAPSDEVAAAARREGLLLRSSQVIGANVHNSRREGIASVNDLVLDSKDRVAFAVLGKGGFLTLGESHIAVPLEALSMHQMEDELVLTLDMTDERLKQAPTLEQDGFQDLRDTQFVENTRRFFGVTDRQEIEAEAPAKPKRDEQPREDQ